MALRDTWHRTLVYFGLAEEEDGYREEVAAEVDSRAKVVISILAAVPTARLAAAYPGAPVYRFIPNIPAEVSRGVLCYTPGPRGSPFRPG